MPNRASWLSDHTSYWTNLEQVVLPLALHIGQAAGLPLDKLYPFDPAWLQQAQSRRNLRVNCLVWLRVAFWLAFGAMVMLNAPPWLALLQVTWAEVRALLSGADVNLAATKAAARVVAPALLLVGLAFVALLLTWRGWDLHEQRQFLARETPGYWPVLGLTMLAVLAVSSPLLFAGWSRWGGSLLNWFGL